jgi:hypothetical protein
MKEILNKLAALADEADTAGHAEVANQIDGIIKTFAADGGDPEAVAPMIKDFEAPPVFVPNRGIMFIRKYEEYKKLSDEDKKKFLAANPDFVKDKGHLVPPTSKEVDDAFKSVVKTKVYQDANKAPSVKDQHEKARQQMEQIAKLYTDIGRPAPFTVPASGQATGQQILDFLNKAGKGGPLASWSDMFARLNEIKGDAHLFALDMKKDPFGKDSTTMVADNEFKSLPPDYFKAKAPGEMDFLPGEVEGKGPPKPPRGM